MGTKSRFVDNGNGTVSDMDNGLMWTRTDSMNDLEKWVNYQEGADYARELNEKKFAGYSDWRLPSKEEITTIYEESSSIKDKFGKDIHLSGCFAEGGGFSMMAQLISGRPRTWVFNIRTGEFTQPDGLWTLAEAARAVRTINSQNK